MKNFDDSIKIENVEGSSTIFNFKCTDYPEDNCKLHLSFDVKVDVGEYYFSTNFSEMFYGQFNFKTGENRIIDENNQNKELVIDKDSVSLLVDEKNDLTSFKTNVKINFEKDKVDEFKLMLNACAYYILGML